MTATPLQAWAAVRRAQEDRTAGRERAHVSAERAARMVAEAQAAGPLWLRWLQAVACVGRPR